MAKQQANLLSTTFKEGRRGNITIANIANIDKNKLEYNIKKLFLDARMDEPNEEDLKELQNQGEKIVKGKTNKNSEATYKRYHNLW